MPNILAAKNLSKTFDSRPLFQNITFGIQEGEHIGLIGNNGSGKSTLLKILAGQMEPDEGERITQKSLKTSLLDQDPRFQPNLSVRDYLISHASDPTDWTATHDSDEILWKLDLASVGLTAETPIETLSGGLKKRVALAGALMKRPDLLLLDEPTNHLDVEGILWLETILNDAPFAWVVVTHDRVFLDRVCRQIFELDRHHAEGFLRVEGNYSRYLQIKASTLEALEGREESLRSVLRRETEWLHAGVRAQRSKQSARIQRHETLRLELQDVTRRNAQRTADLEFQSVDQSPYKLLEAKKLSKSFGRDQYLFRNFDLLLTPGTRLGILGENGCGKSTLIRTLLGQELPNEGRVFRSEQLKVSYFEQNREALDLTQTLLRNICPYGDGVVYQGRALHIRTYLDRFLFTKDQIDLPLGKLSGGERSRAVLAKLMLKEANLLVLDEPTNDLDIPTLNVLQDCLTEFDGAMIVVSHDRYFLDHVATEILAFAISPSERSAGVIHKFADLYQWEQWHQEQRRLKPARPQNKTRSASPQIQHSNKETERLLKKIESLEHKKQAIENQFSDSEILSNQNKMLELSRRLKEIDDEIKTLYRQWEKIESP